MDTSTISFTDLPVPDLDAASTSAPITQSPLPAEWLAQLISPLTRHDELRHEGSAIRVGDSGSDPFGGGGGSIDGSGFTYNKLTKQMAWSTPQIRPVSAMATEGAGGVIAAAAVAGGIVFDDPDDGTPSTLLLIFIPILVVSLTVLLGVIVFLIAVLFMRRRSGIRLVEDGGPLDLSKGDGVIGEGGVDGVEARWLETCDPDVREAYRRAKDWQLQYPPSSVPTDITLSQFLSIQEKGVAAWAFEPDYEDNLSLYVQSRTEITFLSDGPGMHAREGGGNSVLANLPLPKLNEVYYFEVKMYDKPATTEVAIGLATKPYPSFRLPGWNRFSVAYFASDGFKSHNYPFTASSYGPALAEGDVLGVGYRPRAGTVFFTRNGRKLEDCYTGLQRLNLFPTVGANGPCTVHVNLGQAGFVFIEANVKKWGLAPMVGTLAPPPAYGSERGSILLDAGYGTPGSSGQNAANSSSGLGGINALLEAARARAASNASAASGQQASSYVSSSTPQFARAIPNSPGSNRSQAGSSSRRHRRAGKVANLGTSVPAVPSPLRATEAGGVAAGSGSGASSLNSGPGPTTAGSRRRALAHGGLEDEVTYVSPTDTPHVEARVPSADALEYVISDPEDTGEAHESGGQVGVSGDAESDSDYASTAGESSPMDPNPPTPNLLDISLHSLRGGASYFGGRRRDDANGGTTSRSGSGGSGGSGGSASGSGESDETARPGSGWLRGRGGAGAGAGGRSEGYTQVNDTSPPPPGYAPLDPNVYSGGLPTDLPEELINQAIAAMSDPSTPALPETPTPQRAATTAAGSRSWIPSFNSRR